MFPGKAPFIAVFAVLWLAGCGKPPAAPKPQAAAAAEAGGEAGYMAPPGVDQVRPGEGGLILAGTAPAAARVRLATPAGEARFASADAQGRWALALGPVDEPRVFGLSATAGGRQAQAQGYVLVTPDGRAALLRAGAGAIRLDRPVQVGVDAVDFDGDGGAVVSGAAPAGAALLIRVDGREAGQGRADQAGRYSVALPSPVARGVHRLQLFGDGFTDALELETSPAAPLAAGPLRSQLTRAGLRVDWTTPGGGVQSTVLVH
jgi:hypothetical protein